MSINRRNGSDATTRVQFVIASPTSLVCSSPHAHTMSTPPSTNMDETCIVRSLISMQWLYVCHTPPCGSRSSCLRAVDHPYSVAQHHYAWRQQTLSPVHHSPRCSVGSSCRRCLTSSDTEVGDRRMSAWLSAARLSLIVQRWFVVSAMSDVIRH